MMMMKKKKVEMKFTLIKGFKLTAINLRKAMAVNQSQTIPLLTKGLS